MISQNGDAKESKDGILILHERDILACTGMTGYGKSSWMKLYTEYTTRLLIYDPKKSYPDVVWCEKAEDIEQALLDGELTEFRMGISDPNEVDAMAETAFTLGDNLFVIEECATVFEKGQRNISPPLRHIIFLGREAKCSIGLLAQRASYIPTDLRSQFTRMITFYQHEGIDIAWLGDNLGKQHLEEVPTLPKFCCLDYNAEDDLNHVTKYSIKDQYISYLERQKRRKEKPLLQKLDDRFFS